MKKFISAYSTKQVVSTTHEGVSLTHQSFAKASDINHIVDRYKTTGVLGDPSLTSPPTYMDCATYPSFQESQDAKVSTLTSFAALPPETRKYFDNDVNEFLSYVHSDDSEKLAVLADFGLIDALDLDVDKPTSKPVEDVKSETEEQLPT